MSLQVTFLAYALIWTLLIAVPAARRIVLLQFGVLPLALRRTFWIGSACGCVLVGVDALVLLRLGTHGPVPAWRPEAAGFVLNIGWVVAVATTEEMLVRGLLLTRLRQLSGDAVAILSTALIFAGMHVGRSDFSALAVLQYGLDGVLLGWLAVRTGAIWAGTGLHLAKNFGVSLLFGGSKQLVAPLLIANSIGGRGPRAEWVDLIAYAVTIPLCLAVFRKSTTKFVAGSH